MNQRASSIGDLAVDVLSRGTQGELTRVFERSAYLKVEDEFVLLLWGTLRSPSTINLRGNREGSWKVGARCRIEPGGVRFESGRIEVEGAEVYRSPLQHPGNAVLPPASALVKGTLALRSLYDASPAGPTLATDAELERFVKGTLSTFAAGRRSRINSFDTYLPLLGRGGGFTPAGDDFVGGVLTAKNYIARCEGSRTVRVHQLHLRARTVPESAALLSYAARGYVDERVGALILKTLDGSGSFSNELLDVARRGHTSGLDMSLGILLFEAALSDSRDRGSAMRRCLEVLWHQ
jgi:hypothetical protein